jgi:anti-sigma B factor antagonist
MITQLIRSQPQTIELIEVVGRIDNFNTRTLGELAEAALAGGRAHVVLDLSQVEYINSAGLRELVSMWKRIKQAGGSLTVANPSPQVQKLLELVGLDTVFEIYADSTRDLLSLATPGLPALRRQTFHCV